VPNPLQAATPYLFNNIYVTPKKANKIDRQKLAKPSFFDVLAFLLV
jgi:hypothetical protein